LNKELRAARAGASSDGSVEEVDLTAEANGEFEVDLQDIIVEKDLSIINKDLTICPDLKDFVEKDLEVIIEMDLGDVLEKDLAVVIEKDLGIVLEKDLVVILNNDICDVIVEDVGAVVE
jgi:hypothetical protein